MDINIHISGLEPLAEAITRLAIAYEAGPKSTAAEVTAATIDKAKGTGKASKSSKPAQEAAASSPESAAPAASQPAADPAPTSQETSTAGSPDEKTEVAENPTTSSTPTSDQASSSTASDTSSPAAAPDAALLTDEALRALAGEKAKTARDAVKTLVSQYAASVTAVPQDKRSEFRRALEAL